jgi:hypothetical protein
VCRASNQFGVIRDVVKAIDSANPPLSPSKQAKGRYAADAIAQAIAHHRGGKVSDVEAEGVLGYIRDSGLAVVQSVKVPRPGGRADVRNGLVVTPQGKAAMQGPAPAGVAAPKSPQSPQSSRGNDAGHGDSGSPKGPRNVPGGCGGNAGTKIAGQAAEAHPIKTAPQAPGAASGAESPLASATALDSSADSPAATRAVLNADPAGPLPEPQIAPAQPAIHDAPAQPAIHDEDAGARRHSYLSQASQQLQLLRPGVVSRQTISPYQTSSDDPFQVPRPPNGAAGSRTRSHHQIIEPRAGMTILRSLPDFLRR